MDSFLNGKCLGKHAVRPMDPMGDKMTSKKSSWGLC